MIKNWKNWTLAIATMGMMAGCAEDEGNSNNIEVPTSYTFSREGESTVSFGGQSTRIAMAEEIVAAMKDNTLTTEAIQSMFAHEVGADDFSDPALNASDKSVKSKTAASLDFYSENAVAKAEFQALMDGYISSQVEEVFPNWETLAAEGVAGQIADGSSVRYVNGNGLEYNQMFAKSLIGALMADQIINNYLSPAKLDAGTNVADNDAGILLEGKSYTNMEHYWDEGYGYLFGASQDGANPLATLGDDSFLNKYLASVDSDEDFAGIADDIFEAFLLGRAAIVAGEYDVRDAQTEILREKISLVIAVRAVHYLQGGKAALEAQSMGAAFHELSEGLGFINSLQFTRKPGTDAPYFGAEKVEGWIAQLLEGNGFWEVSPETLDSISEEIAAAFGFTVAQAAN